VKRRDAVGKHASYDRRGAARFLIGTLVAALCLSRGNVIVTSSEDAACAIGSEILWNGRWEKIGKPHAASHTAFYAPR
jgi:hypothetical protein